MDKSGPFTYEGGCHCGAVRFRVQVRRHLAFECNCSICSKKGFLHVLVERAAFELLCGENDLETYQFNTLVAKHHFCSTCGIAPFYVPRSHPDGITVNARCLDGDVFERFRIEAFDGRNWESNVDQLREASKEKRGG